MFLLSHNAPVLVSWNLIIEKRHKSSRPHLTTLWKMNCFPFHLCFSFPFLCMTSLICELPTSLFYVNYCDQYQVQFCYLRTLGTRLSTVTKTLGKLVTSTWLKSCSVCLGWCVPWHSRGFSEEELRNSIPGLGPHSLGSVGGLQRHRSKEPVFSNFPSWATCVPFHAVFLLNLCSWCSWDFLQRLSSFIPQSFIGVFHLKIWSLTQTFIYLFITCSVLNLFGLYGGI